MTNQLTINIANCLTDRIGGVHGINAADLHAAASRMGDLTDCLAEMDNDGQTR